MVSRFLVFLAIILLVPASLGSSGVDPRRVRVLYTGDPYPGVTPYGPMKEDAFILVTPVQGSRQHYAGITWEDIHKALRVYMPRTYQQLVDNYDVVILSDTNRRIFTPEQHFWLKRFVEEEGKGLLMVGGLETFGAGFGHESWAGSPVEDVLPVTVPRGGVDWVSGGKQHGMYITKEGYENEFIKSLPYKPLPEYMKAGTDGNLVFPKQGATILARWKSPEYNDPPVYVTWDYANGRTYAMMHDWTPGGGWMMSRWDYYGDYAVNLMLYLAKRKLPTDPVVVHEYRRMVHTLMVTKATLFSLIDFVESFGGNPRPINRELGVVDDIVAAAKEDYLDEKWDSALSKAKAAMEKMKEIEDLAMRIKSQALFWVYVIEWLSVSGVSLLSGVVLWSLMVKRKMYREVRTTRGMAR